MAVLAASFMHRLQELACPYVDNVDDSWITELLFKPGEPRLRLLQWLLARFDSHLEELVVTQATRPENMTDSRVQRTHDLLLSHHALLQAMLTSRFCLIGLTLVASLLGLCRANDYDLIRGVSSDSKQTAFMDALLDLVCIAQDSELMTSDRHTSLEPASGLTKLAEQMRRDRRLMNGLANQENVTDMLSSTCQLFPPDLMRLCHQQFDQALTSSGIAPREKSRGRMRPPDQTKLEALVNEMSEQAASQLQILEELKKTTLEARPDKQATDRVMRTLSVCLSTLGQLVSSFCQCYETEFQSWTHKQPLHLSGLGPTCKRVFSLQQQVNALMESLAAVKSSCKSIRENAGFQRCASWKYEQSNTNDSVKIFERCTRVLKNSARR
ncbi:HAUS augmin-like complex subunit 7 isoform X1 [Corticium candelabrum]|uniref:HAUS augmin-like complex subunit 7 isoform X1 n=1 Tax=Corticium candelabrum TaxID=121492 RepID=UPI002E2706C6|nr:HAUS augmin-like complex subunit 7 isoform X1 [Corticium candelabrum]XP_062511494.1 HAUS augmin-like complex subunit 7 isoform X1 [Corticium candelabrum]